MRNLMHLLPFVALALSYSAHAATVATELTILNADLAPDGFTRSTVVANGTFPGPLISANTGDNLQINVIDSLTDSTMFRSTSVHWHGLFQAGTNEMDGAAWVTQCPIIPDDSFLYDFSVPGQAGTFWYHSHVSTQYCDGLRGPLVIYDPNDPHADLYDVDDDTTVITLADWYHGVAPSIFPNPTNVPPTPNATLINGLGRYSGGPTDNSLAVVSAQSGKRHRFRLISLSCDEYFTFSIDGHNMTVIEADGVETQPVDVDSITIYAGQRYSFILNANQSVDNYWIRATPSAGTTGFDDGINSAILRYVGADDVDPTTNQTTSVAPLSESDLIPLENPGAPGEAVSGGVDVALNLAVVFNTTTGEFSINGVVYESPSVPVLLQILSGAQSATDLLPSGSVYTLPKNSTIEVSIPGGLNHPFHLHGHNFDVVRVAGSSTYNYDNPVRRDVVNVGVAGDNVTFRFSTNNPGPWFLHCHIDWHLAAGLAIVFAEDTADIATANPNTTAWNNLCPEYNANDPDTALEATQLTK